MSQCLLVVAAHPDDEILGCGGLMARTLRAGGECHVVILTEGCSTQYPDQPHLIAKKQTEARLALERLASAGGTTTLEFVGLPDMRLSTLAPSEVNQPIEEAVVRLSPDWVLVHHGGDLNRDHQVAHEAARVACRPGPNAPARLLSYETPSSTEWGSEVFKPTVFVPLTEEEMDRKVEAFRAYETEVRKPPHPRDPENIRSLARVRGSQAGVEYAECFDLVWERCPVVPA